MPRGAKFQAMLDGTLRCLGRVSEHRRGQNIQCELANTASHRVLSTLAKGEAAGVQQQYWFAQRPRDAPAAQCLTAMLRDLLCRYSLESSCGLRVSENARLSWSWSCGTISIEG